jgi:phage terminase small subunit
MTDKQLKFCHEYIIDWNATRASIAAGYKEKNARIIGYQNLSKLYIKEYIDKIKNNIEENCNISKTKVILELKKLAFSSISNIYENWITRKEFNELTQDQKDCIQEIDTKIVKTTEDDIPASIEYVKIKLYDKQKAIELIIKALGYNEPEKLLYKDTSYLAGWKPTKEDILEYNKLKDEFQ